MLRVIGVVLCLGIAGVRSTTIERAVSYGTIEGRLLTTKANNSAFAFLGVPFAQKPTGDLRFRKPQEPPPWTTALNCASEKPGCIGDDTKDSQSEDCLYLDILQSEQCEKSGNCAVFAYLHSDLTTDMDSFVDNLVQDGVVVVIITHRQGPLGFLNLASSDNDYDKNVGIHDLILALKFVNNEIDNFGGNKNKVTIGGHGVGGELVGYLTLSQMAKGLFSKAVALSGAPEMHQKLASDASVDPSKKFVERNKCLPDTIGCLRKLSAEALLTSDYYGPTIDGHVFVSNADQLRKTRPPMPYLIGVSSQKNVSHHLPTEQSCRTAAASLGLTSEVVIEKCKEHYDNRGESAIFDATTVLLIVNEAVSMARLSNRTYLYSVVDFSDPYETYTNASRIFTELLKNFIKNDQPGSQWRPLDAVELNYLQLSASKATIKNAVEFHWDAVNFWKYTAPSLQEGYDFKKNEKNNFDYATAFWVAVCVAVVLFMALCVRTMFGCCSNRRRQLFSKYNAIESDDTFHEGDS